MVTLGRIKYLAPATSSTPSTIKRDRTVQTHALATVNPNEHEPTSDGRRDRPRGVV